MIGWACPASAHADGEPRWRGYGSTPMDALLTSALPQAGPVMRAAELHASHGERMYSSRTLRRREQRDTPHMPFDVLRGHSRTTVHTRRGPFDTPRATRRIHRVTRLPPDWRADASGHRSFSPEPLLPEVRMVSWPSARSRSRVFMLLMCASKSAIAYRKCRWGGPIRYRGALVHARNASIAAVARLTRRSRRSRSSVAPKL
jgi:hypothetical protein